MTTRRDFIGGMTGAMAGVAFVGCELMHTTHAHAQPAPRRREVVVNGRRVKTEMCTRIAPSRTPWP